MEKFRLLAIEDNKDIAQLICTAAAAIGFDCKMANGPESPGAYQAFMPHVVVLDILMPGLDGFEFLSFLREEKSEAQIIIFSGSSDTYRRMAQNIGTLSGLNIVGNLAKPFRLKECHAILQRAQLNLSEAA